jgi:polyisoprenoid-binding protein YceI
MNIYSCKTRSRAHRNRLWGLSINLLAALLPLDSVAQKVLHPVASQSAVRFVIRNFGINVEGSLSGLTGDIVFDPGQLQASRFNITLKSGTIQTGNNMRDEHLRKNSYLDVAVYPEIRFRASAVTRAPGADEYSLEGYLTIKKVTRTVKIPFRVTQEGNAYRFLGNFRINRLDYGVGSSSISLSDNLTIYLDVISR